MIAVLRETDGYAESISRREDGSSGNRFATTRNGGFARRVDPRRRNPLLRDNRDNRAHKHRSPSNARDASRVRRAPRRPNSRDSESFSRRNAAVFEGSTSARCELRNVQKRGKARAASGPANRSRDGDLLRAVIGRFAWLRKSGDGNSVFYTADLIAVFDAYGIRGISKRISEIFERANRLMIEATIRSMRLQSFLKIVGDIKMPKGIRAHAIFSRQRALSNDDCLTGNINLISTCLAHIVY